VSDPLTQRRRPATPMRGGAPEKRWPTYLGITALLLSILVALAGGIIWYNSKKTSELAIAAAQRLMQELDDKTIDRIRLLYDPMYAIVGLATAGPVYTNPAGVENADARAAMMRALRAYPQILSLYVGFETGNFFMMTHIAGHKAAALRKSLKAPPDAVFANEIIVPDGAGGRAERWVFLGEDGAVVGRIDPAPATYDPRRRPWYLAAKDTEIVEHSDLYVFASSGEPGFTLSRSFKGETPGVMGADLAAVDLADFLGQQQITPGSLAFIFTKPGEVVALPNREHIGKMVDKNGAMKMTLPKIADLHDAAISGLVASYQNQQMAGTRVYDVDGRTFIGRVVAIPPRYGQDQLLALAVPVDEIIQPIAEIRNDTLIYSVAFLVCAVPLYVTLVMTWLDRKLGPRRAPAIGSRFRDDE
jgi:adenylate cyclase